MRIFIWKNYIEWSKTIFSSPKYYAKILIWLPVLLVNIYFTVMILAVFVYAVISWGIFSFMGDPGFSVSSISYNVQQTEKAVEIDSVGNTLIACCISGGGSRSAIFSGEMLYLLHTLEEIDDFGQIFQKKKTKAINILDSFDFISSVSGGSVTAVSLCIKRPWEKGSLEAWKEFKTDLQLPYQHKLYLSLANPLNFGQIALTHLDRSNIMEKVWNANLVNNKKLGDLPLRPRLLINATSYNLGKKFVFTTLPRSHFNNMPELYPSFFSDLDPFPTAVTTLDEYQLSSVNCPISTALMASTAFPVGFPPVTIQGYVKGKSKKLHLSDGGIYDNHGIESVLQLFKQSVDNYYNAKQMRLFGGIIFILDASQSSREKFNSPNELDMILHSTEVYEKRMQVYFDRFLQEQIIMSNDIHMPLKFIRFSISELLGIWHLSQKTVAEKEKMAILLQQNERRSVQTNLHGNKLILQWLQRPQKWWNNFKTQCNDIVIGDVATFMTKLANIPTNFALTEDDSQVLEIAAKLIFHMKKEEIVNAYSEVKKNAANFKKIEEMDAIYIKKNPTLYIFEFMRKLQLANKNNKVWMGNYSNLRLAFSKLLLPEKFKNRTYRIIKHMSEIKNFEAQKDFGVSLDLLLKQWKKTFEYIKISK